MTYQDASLQIAKAKKVLHLGIQPNHPIHSILGYFIAPEYRDNSIEQKIFSECVSGKKDNLELLLEMGLIGDNLMPFIVCLVSGENVAQPLLSYIDLDANE